MDVYERYAIQTGRQNRYQNYQSDGSALDNYILAMVSRNRYILDGSSYEAVIGAAAEDIVKAVENAFDGKKYKIAF